MRLVFALALASAGGCGFQHGATSTGGGDDMQVIDGSVIDGANVQPGAEPTPCTPNFLNMCGQAAATMTLDAPGIDSINTDSDPRCRTLTQTNGGPVCLVYVTSASIGGQLIATGSRPLAIASASTITIGGVIDVASRRSDGKTGPGMDGTCSFSATPEMDLGGAGGGAGGSFGAAGGNGGTGDNDTSLGGNDGTGAPGAAGPAFTPVVLRGGCKGQAGANESAAGQAGGTGGHSGGGLYLYAATSITLSSSGVIRASGAGATGGGAHAGGGGGGTGGMVVLESPQLTLAGVIAANGGGGGEGGARVAGPGMGTTNVPGQPGSDGTATTTPAAGGQGSDVRFGFGGAGGAGSTAAVTGTTADTGGGGGGGSVGIIKLIGTSSVTGTLTPPAT